MKNFKGASWDSVFLTFIKVLTILTSIILTKILSVGLSLKEYGTYSQANMIVSISMAILLFGLGDAINYFYNNQENKLDEKERIKIINTIYFLEIVLGCILAFLLIMCRSLIADYFNNIFLNTVILIICFKPMLDNIIYFYQLLYISIGKSKIIALRNLVIAITKLIIMYIGVNSLKKLELIFLYLVILDILQLLLFKLYFFKEAFLINPLKIKKEFIKKILSYSFPMGIFAITNALTRDIDKIVVSKVATLEQVAIYANCSKILPFDILSISFATVLIPYIMKFVSSGDKKNGVLLFKNYIKIGYYSVWIFGTSVLIVSEQAINFLYTNEYVAGNMIFVLYIFDSMIRFASLHLILTAKRKTKLLMIYSIISLMLNTVLNVIFYKIFGIVGPAISTLLVAIFYAGLVLKESFNIMEVSWREVIDLKDVVRFIFILFISAILVTIFNKKMIELKFIEYYLSMIISIVLFIVINFFLNIKNIFGVLKQINQLKL